MRQTVSAALAALALSLATALPATAACQGDSLFQCRIGKKQLDLCQTGNAVSYSFGPAGKPEMQIATAVSDLDYQPWPGFSRAIWEAVSFHNDGVTYEVWSSFDRLDERAVVEGGVNVIRGGKTIAALTCSRGSVEAGLDQLYDAKTAVGQCWNREAARWQSTPCP